MTAATAPDELLRGLASVLTSILERHGHDDHGHEHSSPARRHHEHGDQQGHDTATRNTRRVLLERDVLEKNDRAAGRNRGAFAGRGCWAINLVSARPAERPPCWSAPVRRTRRLPVCVIEGDQASLARRGSPIRARRRSRPADSTPARAATWTPRDSSGPSPRSSPHPAPCSSSRTSATSSAPRSSIWASTRRSCSPRSPKGTTSRSSTAHVPRGLPCCGPQQGRPAPARLLRRVPVRRTPPGR